MHFQSVGLCLGLLFITVNAEFMNDGVDVEDFSENPEESSIKEDDPSSGVGKESAPKVLKEASRRTPLFGSLEEMVAHLVTSLQAGNTCFVLVFLCIYHRFLTTQQVLDMLFKRTLCTLLELWLDKFPEDFCKIEHLPLLQRLKSYLIVNLPYSDLLVRVHNVEMQLLAQMASKEEAKEEEEEEEEASG
ncbi:Ral guanine nucleotide dissociation stimulator [Cricetulus griseus]|uniref:Ral guanine nucleotide dissociation stimulator n=1 Tax=Cricetulus griseus TaxID=10029 RepID=G3IAF8_CRIGR|nr:Ral guanine nucleotide dissociation stimulator [Cricetulus griseus]